MHESEKAFIECLNLPTAHQDMFEHWDLEANGFKYDVKSAKRIKRSDPEPNYRYHWVELVNVRGGKGWLYGKADFISFEAEYIWIIVSRETLRKWVEDNVKDEWDDKFPLLKKKQRWGRADVITLVPSEILIFLATKILKK